jgi:hypothetical protein
MQSAIPTLQTAIPTLQAHDPVLLFGGCYSNLQATQALLGAAQSLNIPPTRIICTGDIVAYAADPAATVDLIRTSAIPVIMGNCEASLGHQANDCGCGFTQGSTCDRLSAAWYAHANAHLDNTARAWMRALPRRIDLVVGDRRLAIVHATPTSINQFVFASTPDATLRPLIEATACDGVIAGHCGIPFTRIVDGKLWHNPGAIGVPAHDGTPRVWFSVLTPLPTGLEIRHHPLDYDHRTATAAMHAAGLPTGYADALHTGLWPGTDVLPPAERAQAGIPLQLSPIIWPAG